MSIALQTEENGDHESKQKNIILFEPSVNPSGNDLSRSTTWSRMEGVPDDAMSEIRLDLIGSALDDTPVRALPS